jgi:ribosomal protein L27
LKGENKMAGGKSTPKKDKAIKVSCGQLVKTGEILCRGVSAYKAGANVRGLATLCALCSGKIYFTRKKTSHGKFRTFINISPQAEKSPK